MTLLALEGAVAEVTGLGGVVAGDRVRAATYAARLDGHDDDLIHAAYRAGLALAELVEEASYTTAAGALLRVELRRMNQTGVL